MRYEEVRAVVGLTFNGSRFLRREEYAEHTKNKLLRDCGLPSDALTAEYLERIMENARKEWDNMSGVCYLRVEDGIRDERDGPVRFHERIANCSCDRLRTAQRAVVEMTNELSQCREYQRRLEAAIAARPKC